VPTETFADSKTVKANDSTLHLTWYGPAHTDGDISVHFAEADILHTGDTFWNGVYPFIDYSTGGNIDGTIRAAEANLATASSKTIVVPGHGPVGDRAQLVEFRDMLAGIRDRVATLKKQGRSLDETIAAKPTTPFDAKWGNFVIDPDFFTKLVYTGV
jgi:glyoxylase-like metal-dependent hydrolase (beta-lactamase superfamily II)